uniref:Uncharacterized protein n=1 Tax=Bacteriophage sp. TaxID=38018 RepID=A0A8D9PGZ4_9VIRU|nr:MAG TPA: hypothetical protein [Bacteriophage sp.]
MFPTVIRQKISKKITPLRRLLNFYDYFLDYLFIFL